MNKQDIIDAALAHLGDDTKSYTNAFIEGAIWAAEYIQGPVVATTPMKVAIEVATDDDFTLLLNGKYIQNHEIFYFKSVADAIMALKTAKVREADSWTQEGNRFIRKTEINPKEHWFYDWINEAVEALESGPDGYYRSGNQTLDVTVLS